MRKSTKKIWTLIFFYVANDNLNEGYNFFDND